jgi:hypothetical protein
MSKPLTREHFENLAAERNQTVEDFSSYKGIHSNITFYCHECYTTFTTSGHSYKNAKKTGCPGCKKVTTSKNRKGKPTSDYTKALIGKKKLL